MKKLVLNNSLFKGNTREKNSFRNVAAGMTFQIISLILNFFSKSAIINTLGVEYLGIQGLFSNIFILISFSELGVAAVMTYYLYYPLSEGNQEKIASLYHFFDKLYKIMAILSLGVGLLCLIILPLIVNSNIEYNRVVAYYLIYLAATVIYNLYIFRTYIIMADQKKYIISLAQIIFDGGSLAIGIAILYLTGSYTIFLINIIIRNLLFNWYMGRKVSKLYPFLKNKQETSKDVKLKIIKDIKDLFVYKLANSILTSTDNIFISVIIGTVYVGFYSNYQLVVYGVKSLTCILFDSISASIGNFLVETDKEKQYKIYMVIQVVNMWVAGFTTVCIYVLIQDFIYLWVGKSVSLSLAIVAIIVINYYLDSIRLSTTVFREAAGLFEKIKWAVVLKAIINIVLSVILGIRFGLMGIFVATAIATLVTTYWYEPLILQKTYLDHSVFKNVLIQIEGVLSVVVCIYVSQLITSVIHVSGWLTFSLKAIFCLIISNLFYLLIMVMHKSEFKVLFNSFKSILKN